MVSIARMYEEYSEAVYQFIYFLVGEEELSKDLMQETFLKAMNHFSGFRRDASEKTWLMKIARNLVYDHFRRKKVLKFIPFLQKHEQLEPTYVPERWLESKDSQYKLYKALGQLPYQYREVIVLRKIEGFSIKESAKILGWNGVKVRNATERGMKKLQQLLGGDEDA